jgi:hypothetical protein
MKTIFGMIGMFCMVAGMSAVDPTPVWAICLMFVTGICFCGLAMKMNKPVVYVNRFRN